jgi:FAD/FMN-containing dehydrogenase
LAVDLIGSHDARYDQARSVYNAMIDRRPAVIAQCWTPAEVGHALDLADREDFAVAVRAGGHSVAGLSVNDGGMVIDVRPMKSITVNPSARTARVGAGVTWGEFDRVTQEYGLATTGGRVSTTGVAGLTLGGGSGWLERKYGLACDNLISVELVTADGREVTASASENPELFWALRGGGGNFGVVTAFEFQLHPVGPTVLSGLLAWPAAAGREVTRVYRDVAYDAPPELGSGLVFLTGPDAEFVPEQLRGTTIAGMALLWAGDPAEGQDAIKPFLDLQPAGNLVMPMPYVDFQKLIDNPPGLRNYWTADYLDELSDDAVDVFVTYGIQRKSALTQQILLPWGGAVTEHDDGSTPLGNRSAHWLTHPFAVWEDSADNDANIDWARGYRRDIAEYTNSGTFLNFIGDEGQDRVRAAFGPGNYARLATVKAAFDPHNVFHGNQNIKPGGV